MASQPRKGFLVPLSLSLRLGPAVGVLKQCGHLHRAHPNAYMKHKHPQSSGGALEELKTLLFQDEALLVG